VARVLYSVCLEWGSHQLAGEVRKSRCAIWTEGSPCLLVSNYVKIWRRRCSELNLVVGSQASELGVATRRVWSLDLVAMLLLWPQVTGVYRSDKIRSFEAANRRLCSRALNSIKYVAFLLHPLVLCKTHNTLVDMVPSRPRACGLGITTLCALQPDWLGRCAASNIPPADDWAAAYTFGPKYTRM
jgi:hypothetical protein